MNDQTATKIRSYIHRAEKQAQFWEEILRVHRLRDPSDLKAATYAREARAENLASAAWWTNFLRGYRNLGDSDQ